MLACSAGVTGSQFVVADLKLHGSFSLCNQVMRNTFAGVYVSLLIIWMADSCVYVMVRVA
jgi:hypothetical protein